MGLSSNLDYLTFVQKWMVSNNPGMTVRPLTFLVKGYWDILFLHEKTAFNVKWVLMIFEAATPIHKWSLNIVLTHYVQLKKNCTRHPCSQLPLTFYRPRVSIIANPLTTVSHYSGSNLPRENENGVRLWTQLRWKSGSSLPCSHYTWPSGSTLRTELYEERGR